MGRILRALQSRGWSRGIRGGSRAWMALGAAAWAFSRIRKGEPRPVYSEKLEPGEQLLVTHRTETRRELGGRRFRRAVR